MKNFFTFGFIMFCLLGYSQDLPFLNDENLPSENQSIDILSNYENGIKKITKFHKNGQMSQQGYLKKINFMVSGYPILKPEKEFVLLTMIMARSTEFGCSGKMKL